ncbi:unnamed protein product [Owenia fusiformis]|uniref:Haloacid dehalogenase-like hydrolase domain-containing protein 2 n=1 Tax=Owenia fusiformis TaxID=6347 RepID=A0A8J1TTM3_OWEFU|nr:unnamed protein product [Owenia fusiformis]
MSLNIFLRTFHNLTSKRQFLKIQWKKLEKNYFPVQKRNHLSQSINSNSDMPPSGKARTVLIDLSGTVHVESTAISTAHSAIERLRDTSLNIRFVTNSSKESKLSLYKRLKNMGFDIKMDEIFTSLTAARQLVETRKLRPMLILTEEAMDDFKGIPNEDPNAVLVGLTPDKFNYEHLNTAFRVLLDKPDIPLIAINKARYIKQLSGLSLATGPFVTALEYAVDRKAELVGKPNSAFFLESIKDFGCEASSTVMIGDDVRDDVEGAMKIGMFGILVKTGKYRDGDETKIKPGPDAICSDIGDAVEYIITNLT